MENIEEDWNVSREENIIKQRERGELLEGLIKESRFDWLAEYLRGPPVYSHVEVEDIPDELKKAIVSMGAGTHELLGSGTEGVAIDIGNGKVLKLYTEHAGFSEDKQNRLSRDLIFKHKEYSADEPMIFAFGSFYSHENKIGWKILERFVDSKTYTRRYGDASQASLDNASYYPIANAASYAAINAMNWIIKDRHTRMVRYEILELRDDDPERAAAALAQLSDRTIAEGVSVVKKSLLNQLPDDFMRTLEDSKVLSLADDWVDKFAKHIFFLAITGRVGDLSGNNLGFRPSSGTFSFFDV